MFKILSKEVLNPTVTRMAIEAPFVAKKAKAGQFIILRTDKEGERIPLTVAGTDPVKGSVSIIFQVVGATTEKLNQKKAGDYLEDFVGPLGRPSEIEGLKNVAVIGGGAGCAIALPLAEALHKQGTRVTSIVGFRGKDLVILEKDFANCSDKFIKMSDDGTWGEKGLVTAALEREIKNGVKFDAVIAIGPLIMMKFVCKTTQPYGIKTIVSMNPIMIDGTGMCGGCRIMVGGKMKFACVDGPDFNGFDIDWDSAMTRNAMYRPWERKKYEEACNLFKEGK
ncbi:MAG: sulfide/dihydroorotate dehydrogenase-like FAD/NAD-binding protein [Bacilli bacterium]|nr:sulfide/dihydroorotate dehydrogenase-like FAD/NAD-binding protein [Bacilli bacterium]